MKKLYGLIGYPLLHSFSQRYFTNKFFNEGIRDCEYELFSLEKITAFPKLLKENSKLCGLNVTLPYKESIIKYLTGSDPVAASIGAVNCIRIDGKDLIGYNTDAPAFEITLLDFIGDLRPQALVLGYGGVAKAIVYTLKKLGFGFHTVSRDPQKGDYTYPDLTASIIKDHKLIINGTSLGTFPDINAHPEIPYEAMTGEHFCYDVVYNPPRTEFLRKSSERGAKTTNGYPMFRQQAEESWRIWNE